MYSAIRYAGSVIRKKKPIQLTFFLTRRCNSRCPFCFYLKDARPAAYDHPELSLAEIQKIALSAGRLFWIAFSGGEIYLRDDLAEISRAFYDTGKPVVMLFPTNGLMPEKIRDQTERILDYCTKSVVAVKLSLDGVGSAHDRLRNTPGSFEKTLETYRLLEPLLKKHPQFELGVNTVFCSENQDSIDEIIDFTDTLRSIGTHTISLVRGNLAAPNFKNVDPDKYLHAIKRLGENLARASAKKYRFAGARIKAAQDVLQRKLIHRILTEQKRLIPCYAGRLNLVLSETGEVYPCEILRECFGNVRDYGYDMSKVVKSERGEKIIRDIEANQCCCTHECYMMTNILFNPKLYAEIGREWLKLNFNGF